MAPAPVQTPNAPAAIGPYSQGVRAGDFLFVSGQLPIDPQTGEMVTGSIQVKADRVISNVRAVAEAAGAGLDQVVKTTVFLRNMADFKDVNEVYARHFSAFLPARSAIGVAALPKDADIEMEAIVYLGK